MARGRGGGMKLAAAVAAAIFLAAPASAQDSKLSNDDLSVVMAAYADSVTELRQFRRACDTSEGDGWDEGSALLVASLRAAGAEALAADVELRLAANAQAAYDCSSEVSRSRLTTIHPGTWSDLHQAVLDNIGIDAVTPGAPLNARLEAIRTVFASEIPAQERMLNCMALLEPRWFPGSYADWNALLAEVGADLQNAGYAAGEAEEIIAPARAGILLKPVARDRQIAIAECLADQDWMERNYTFQWLGLRGDVRALLEDKQ